MKGLDYLKLIRYKNLLIIVVTMYAVRYGIIKPFLHNVAYELQMDNLHFFLLVIATVSIAAAGYAINDYFDVRSDMMNHPDAVIVGTKIPRRKAIMINNIFNFIGVVLGFYVSIYIGLIQMGFLFFIISVLLWLYSSYLKKFVFWGNFVVAFFAALVPLLPTLFEIPLLNQVIGKGRTPVELKSVGMIFLFSAGYAFFAFILTLIREIIKDIEDMKGDVELNRNTIPLVLGIKASKIIVLSLIAITIVFLYIAYFSFLKDVFSLIYLTITITFPLIYLSFRIINATQQKAFFKISQQLKWVMLAGIVYLGFLSILI